MTLHAEPRSPTPPNPQDAAAAQRISRWTIAGAGMVIGLGMAVLVVHEEPWLDALRRDSTSLLLGLAMLCGGLAMAARAEGRTAAAGRYGVLQWVLLLLNALHFGARRAWAGDAALVLGLTLAGIAFSAWHAWRARHRA